MSDLEREEPAPDIPSETAPLAQPASSAPDAHPSDSQRPLIAPGAGADPLAEPSDDPVVPAPRLRPASQDRRRVGPLAERPEVAIDVPGDRLRAQSRRDFLLFAAGAVATAAGAWWLLPDRTKARLLPPGPRNALDTIAGRVGLSRANRERALNRVLTFDDDVAEALYSRDRRVRTYDRSEVTALPNNYFGRTPGPEYLPGWRLELSGLTSRRSERIAIAPLMERFPFHEQVTRLVCVEGWSAVAWWGGIRFADLLAAFPPAPGARWAAMRSAVNLDGNGRPTPYYVSIDLETARHPQTLLATHQGGQPLTLAHGAPLRLLAPMKLGLKNIKAITEIAYTVDEPQDYWARYGYSRYDGL
jgi:DMSO/TMAO reductase YedYZ molybdopterin-dependent catalytic subunit